MADIGLGTLLVLALILAAEFVNGWTDAPNAIASPATDPGPLTSISIQIFTKPAKSPKASRMM